MEDNGDPTSRPASVSGPQPVSPQGAAASSRYGEGDVIAGKYELGHPLGEGGMGEVWLAHNLTLDIDVAIKLIRAEDALSEEMADRLLNEARAAARLGHPAIVRVNDFGKSERGDPYIVMELLSGEDLAETLSQRGRFGATTAVQMLLPIAHALTTAHTKGIVHRDLKPENIYLARTDDDLIQPKLVDFGIAKLEARYPGQLTETGGTLGSPLYMSPEQARGDDVDHRADIWALAVVLYELLTGRPPFDGKNYNAVVYSIIANPATPITNFGMGDEELWSVLERALQKDPDRRWYSMRDFGEALAIWLEERGVTDDITGASLQATWLQWKNDNNKLDTFPPEPTSAPPTAANIPPPPSLPGRSREVTVKTSRTRRSQYFPLLVLAAAALLILVAGAVVASSNRERVVEGVPLPETSPPAKSKGSETHSGTAPASATPSTLSGQSTTTPPASPADEDSRQAPRERSAVDSEPAISPSALPPADEDDSASAAPAGEEPAKKPARVQAASPAKRPKPAATRAKPAKKRSRRLKNPFE